MPSHHSMTVDVLARQVGTRDAPVVLDVRLSEDFLSDPRVMPAARRSGFLDHDDHLRKAAGRPVVVVCQKGLKLSEGVAAHLRLRGVAARVLEGGFAAWREAGLPLVPAGELPVMPPSAAGSLWVTRERPKIDRIACPWLIRRFIDADAQFLYVRASEVPAVAERFGATPFDVEGCRWSHLGDRCTFDAMVEAFGLESGPMAKLAAIVRAADTACLEAVPQAAGLLAISLGLSRLINDDLRQLEAGLLIYDALYAWCRDASDETHNWPAKRV